LQTPLILSQKPQFYAVNAALSQTMTIIETGYTLFIFGF
jgi:hypothetical protein